ncbi:MAG: hypothetical protein U0324_10175 [Polyangiales bacterium]
MRAARHALAAGIALAACVAQPQETLRRPLPPDAVPLVSHLEPPLRLRRMIVTVDGGPTFVFDDAERRAPLPAYVMLRAPGGSGERHLQVHLEVAHPCFPSGPALPTERVLARTMFRADALPTRIELYQDPGVRSAGTGVHVRVVGALRPSDLLSRPSPPALPPAVVVGCVRALRRRIDEFIRDSVARCDVAGVDHGQYLFESLHRALRWLYAGPSPENPVDDLGPLLDGLPGAGPTELRVEALCRRFEESAFGWGDDFVGAAACPWGERRRDLRGCDAYPDHDTPLPSAIAPLWP